MITPDTSVTKLWSVGKALEKKLARIHVRTCQDVLFHIPFRFDDFSTVIPIAQLQPGQNATIHGQIRLINNRRSPRKRTIITEALIADETGQIQVVWFNQAFLTKNLQVGDEVSLSGKTSENYFALQLVSPTYEKINTNQETLHTGRLAPVYPLTEGITQKQFRTLVSIAHEQCGGQIKDWVPSEVIFKEELPTLHEALTKIHFPEDLAEYESARTRLAFNELLSIQLYAQRKKSTRAREHAQGILRNKDKEDIFIGNLPFTLTNDQKETLEEVLKDMAQSHPMNRLLQGDVGSGKTAVAAVAAYMAYTGGGQVALMAPTEILARQHYETFTQTFFKDQDTKIALLTSKDIRITPQPEDLPKTKKGTREYVHTAIAHGDIDIVIGTHALIQKEVSFENLTLVIIDEQHRFGVEQRKNLKEKNRARTNPHLLSLSATPIPRSLALTVYGDLDISSIKEMPKGRKPIITKVTPARYRNWTYNFTHEQIQQGRQAFIICPLIDPSDKLGVKAVTEEYEHLKEEIFPDLKLGLLHGKMSVKQKEEVMKEMLENETQILVSTSVVEVGVDVPNATVMLIEGAERFGLAQLHQFRGRVGRSEHQSYCFLLPTTQEQEEVGRLKALTETQSGFDLAEKDMKLRGAGDMYGTRQSGLPTLRIATLQDYTLIKKAQKWAGVIMENINQYPQVKEKLDQFEHDIHME